MTLAMSRPWKHPKTGVYWLRKAVPLDLRTVVGKREEKVSLKTKDPVEAKRRHAAALASVEERWANLRTPKRRLGDAELREFTDLVYRLRLEGRIGDDPFWASSLADDVWLEENTFLLFPGRFEIDREASAREGQRQGARFWCQQAARDIMFQRGLAVDDDSALNLAKAVGYGRRLAELTLEERRKGNFASASTLPHLPTAAPPAPKVQSPVPFQSLLNGWATEKQPVEKTKYSWERILNQLAAFLGHDDACRLSAEDLVRWKEALLTSGLRTKTIRDSKIAPLRAILQWGVDNRKINENPAARIVVDVRVKAVERRRGYTDEEAALILKNAAHETDRVKRWVPMLCAYSGARISEVCQLRVEDILQIGKAKDIWCMKFDPAAGSLKTDSSERAVPLHDEIISSGFLAFVKSVGKGPLFAELAADRFGNRGGIGTKVIGKWVRGMGLDDLRLSPSHSWRHRFKTIGRQLGLAPDIVDAITGHHRKTVADSYGEFPIEALQREMKKIPAVSF